MKNQSISLAALAVLAASAQAAIITDSDFTNAFNGGLNSKLPLATNNQVYAGASGSGVLATDAGWFAGKSTTDNSILTGTAPRLTLTAAAINQTSNDWASSFGQINTDNGASTGEWMFTFDVSFANTWDAGDEVQFFVQIFGIPSTLGFDAGIQMVNSGFNTVGYTDVGTFSTAAISTAGTYSTDTFDLGTGYDLIGFRIQAIEPLGNVDFGENVFINDINAVSAIPEPSSFALVAGLLGGLALFYRRRRS